MFLQTTVMHRIITSTPVTRAPAPNPAPPSTHPPNPSPFFDTPVAQNGMAYEAEGGVYFDVEGMGSDYGKLGVQAAGSTTPEGEGGSDLRGKRSHKDFALWKKAKEGEPW